MLIAEFEQLQPNKLCNADCRKLHCARNKKNRVTFAEGENLKVVDGRSLCVNYLPVFKLNRRQKRQMLILKEWRDDEKRETNGEFQFE